MEEPFGTDISRHVWSSRYRVAGERDLADTLARVAADVASVEADPAGWAIKFRQALAGFRFLPGGRILAGAGGGLERTLFNCFVMGSLPDDPAGLMRALDEGARTMQQGGGVGYDFSPLSPAGTPLPGDRGFSAGPVAWMRLWDAMCATVLTTGARRGAMMATLRCDHPDIEAFVDAKRDARELRRFNLSVLVTDAFLEAVRADAPWPLVVPDPQGDVVRALPDAGPVRCRIVRATSARSLWERILRATYDVAEPGVLFVDHIAAMDNLSWRHRVSATNPCGEIPLQPYGACDLGSIDLVPFVVDPFGPNARLDLAAIESLVPVAVRFLDDVIDRSSFPLAPQQAEAQATRRIGLGLTGLGDTLILLGLRYDDPAARALAERVMSTIAVAAYRASTSLAAEKGPFPAFDPTRYLERPFVRRLPATLREGIGRFGLRNSHLLAIAPTGTISLLADNVSSGVEPVFAWRYERAVGTPDGTKRFELSSWAWRLWQDRGGGPLPRAFVRADEVSPADQLAMQAALQGWVDNAVSKTILIPSDMPFGEFADVYDMAWSLGLKGCTTWRPNAVTGTVLSLVDDCRGGCQL